MRLAICKKYHPAYNEEKFPLGCPLCNNSYDKIMNPRRPSFDDIYMHMALMMAHRSTCSRAQVGCIIVTQDNQKVLSVGYNGGPKGLFNECQSLEPGKCGHLHAEINALIKANYSDAAPKKAYVTSSPCSACATALINGGIQEVIYYSLYRDSTGVRLLLEAGIKVRKHVPTWDPPRSVPVEQDG